MAARLYMLLLGATVPGRFTEQHDVFFGIADSLHELVPAIRDAWPGAKVHIDAWREVTQVNNFHIEVIPAGQGGKQDHGLFFINLGGYKQNEFDEFHYKILSVAGDKGEAIRESKQTTFYKHMGFEKATSHIDDKYGVDVDDIYAITDILSPRFKQQFDLLITLSPGKPDPINLGYFKLDKLEGLTI
ncbi:MAG: DUF1543 domain-containing protein [Chitinophagaceae bacterium]|nr:MAG: DUF1543 domain-containing protein [Chitinophagaceae bacterium]